MRLSIRSERGVIELIAILILVVAIPVTVVALGQTQDFRNFAAGTNSIDIKANGSDGPLQIPINTPVSITWNSTARAQCQGLNNLTGRVSNYTGSTTVSSSNLGTKIYTVRCYESLTPDSPYVEDSLQIQFVMPALAPAAPYSRMYGNGFDDQVTVKNGDTVLFNWNYAGVTNCMLTNGDTGFGRNVNAAGSELRRVSKSSLYSITCYEPTRRKSYLDHVTVYVVNPTPTQVQATATPPQNSPTTRPVTSMPTRIPTIGNITPIPTTPPVSVDLRANGNPDALWVNMNSIATLSWSTKNATSCFASGGWNGARATSGTETIQNITTAAIFYITCTNGTNVTADSITIYVNPSSNCDPRGRIPCSPTKPPIYYSPTPTASCPRGRC